MTMPAKIKAAIARAIMAHVQASTNDAVVNLGPRGQILDNAMADLADVVPNEWRRKLDGEWVPTNVAPPEAPTLKPKVYPIVKRAVEEGARTGYRRAHKHTPKPSEDVIVEAVESAIMVALCEVIDFGDE